jgi:radical SAM superfamily enzyme YgiQ (UPF0313 family)
VKIQFLWPNFDCPLGPSVGVAYLSGALKAAGHDTNIIHISEWLDYPLDIARVVSDVRDYGPDLVAMSTGANHYPESRAILEQVKRELDLPILIGGIHATLNARSILEESPFIDLAGIGEGDDCIVELVEAIEKGRDTSNIPNIFARVGDTIKINPARPLKDIAKIPWQDLDAWPQYQRIVDSRRGWVNVFMNRGCPYRCTYCHNEGVSRVLQESYDAPSTNNDALGYLRLRGIDDMLGELKWIVDRFDGVKAFSFNDDTFTMDQPHMKEFLLRYKDEIGIPFVCNTTVLDVDREMLEIMKEAQCNLVRFGVETATTRIKRRVLRRDFSNQKTEEVFRICHEIGLRSSSFNMIGNPTETLDEMVDTLKLNAKLSPNAVRLSLGYPYPGTAYHDIAAQLDLIDETKHFHNYLHDTKLKWSDEERLWIDKARTCFWWWMNAHSSSAAAPVYAELVKMVEAIGGEEWSDPEMERRIWDLDESISKVLQANGVTHYAASFKDRPDYAILQKGREMTMRREFLDEH